MVLCNKLEEVLEENVALILGQAIDALRETFIDVNALPAGHWVSSNNGMGSKQIAANVERRTSLAISKLVSQSAGFIMEERGVVRGCQAFQHNLHWLRQTIVYLIPRCPKLNWIMLESVVYLDIVLLTVSPPVSGRVCIWSIA